MSDRRVVRLIVRGRVQAVGYRAFLEDEALRRGLEGWVRNRHDRSVEAVVAGPVEKVETLIEVCRRGPPAARVDSVDVETASVQLLDRRIEGDRFSLLPTV